MKEHLEIPEEWLEESEYDTVDWKFMRCGWKMEKEQQEIEER